MRLRPIYKKQNWLVLYKNKEGKTFQGTYFGVKKDLPLKLKETLPGVKILKIVKKSRFVNTSRKREKDDEKKD